MSSGRPGIRPAFYFEPFFCIWHSACIMLIRVLVPGQFPLQRPEAAMQADDPHLCRMRLLRDDGVLIGLAGCGIGSRLPSHRASPAPVGHPSPLLP